MSHDYLITAAAPFLPLALEEMGRAALSTEALEHIREEIVLIRTDRDLGEMHDALRRRPPVFVRHIVPVQAALDLSGDPEADLEALANAALSLPASELLQEGDSFSVQARVVTAENESRPFSPYAIAQAIAPTLEAQSGATVNVRAPDLVLSVLATPRRAWLGLSPVAFNRSDWAGGERRFRRELGQLSRAEFKLLEAMEIFGLSVPPNALVLDLGAAPGGWTRILLAEGADVTAVDPAPLDESLHRTPRLRRIEDYALPWIEHAREEGIKYDIVLSDIRMDARDAARLMIEVAPLMHLDSWTLVTLKLPSPDAPGMAVGELLAHALTMLEERFRTVQARQLFHNRNEVTVRLGL